MAKNNKPGVMIYFEMFSGMKKLDYEQMGMLFEAIMVYSQTGEEPEFDEFVCDVAWDFIKPRLDNDSQRYDDVVDSRKAAADARWSKKKSAPQPETNASAQMQTDAKNAHASEPMQVHDEKCKCIFDDAEEFPAMQTMPTTTTTTTTTTTPTTTTTVCVPRTRGKNTHRETAPTLDDVKSYAASQGLKIDDPERFIAYNTGKGWPMKWREALRLWCSPRSSPTRELKDQQYNQREYTHTDDAADALMGGLP